MAGCRLFEAIVGGVCGVCHTKDRKRKNEIVRLPSCNKDTNNQKFTNKFTEPEDEVKFNSSFFMPSGEGHQKRKLAYHDDMS